MAAQPSNRSLLLTWIMVPILAFSGILLMARAFRATVGETEWLVTSINNGTLNIIRFSQGNQDTLSTLSGFSTSRIVAGAKFDTSGLYTYILHSGLSKSSDSFDWSVEEVKTETHLYGRGNVSGCKGHHPRSNPSYGAHQMGTRSNWRFQGRNPYRRKSSGQVHNQALQVIITIIRIHLSGDGNIS